MKESQRLQNKANDLHDEIDALVAKAQQTKNDVCLFDLPKEEENAIKADLGTVLKAWRPSAGGYISINVYMILFCCFIENDFFLLISFFFFSFFFFLYI